MRHACSAKKPIKSDAALQVEKFHRRCASVLRCIFYCAAGTDVSSCKEKARHTKMNDICGPEAMGNAEVSEPYPERLMPVLHEFVNAGFTQSDCSGSSSLYSSLVNGIPFRRFSSHQAMPNHAFVSYTAQTSNHEPHKPKGQYQDHIMQRQVLSGASS